MSIPPPAALKDAAARLKKQAKALETLANVITPPAAARIELALVALEKAGAVDVPALRADMAAWLVEEKAGRRERLNADLRAGCEAAGVELLVITRDPLELRIPPLGVRIDVEAGKSTLTFGRENVEAADASAGGILAARTRALAALEGTGWDPAGFHLRLRRAWSRSAPEPGAWVEIAELLPELVFLSQPKAFRADPSARRFVAYSRAQLCYDLWRLRRDRGLSHDGWRLTVAPATGASTKDKSRVFWLEDDRGAGQYHLTLRFVREDTTRVD